MGLSFSEEVTLSDEKNQRIQELETENKQLQDKLHLLGNSMKGDSNTVTYQHSSFEFAEGVVLTDPKRIFSVEISENFNEDFTKETDGLETDEDIENYKKSKGLQTDEELDEYVEQHKEYEVGIEILRDSFNCQTDKYTRHFKKGEFDDFKRKFVEWAGPKFSYL